MHPKYRQPREKDIYSSPSQDCKWHITYDRCNCPECKNPGHERCIGSRLCEEWKLPDHAIDKLETINFDGHVWEFGFFGEKNNGYSAYGFRQDGIIIRVTSEYEAKLLADIFRYVAPKQVPAKD
jgi:hypothetical protein